MTLTPRMCEIEDQLYDLYCLSNGKTTPRIEELEAEYIEELRKLCDKQENK